MHRTYYDRSELFQPLELLDEVHDSFKFQYPVDPLRLAEVLNRVDLDYINPMCVYSSKEFYIGTSVKIGYTFGSLNDDTVNKDVKKTEDSIRQALNEAEVK